MCCCLMDGEPGCSGSDRLAVYVQDDGEECSFYTTVGHGLSPAPGKKKCSASTRLGSSRVALRLHGFQVSPQQSGLKLATMVCECNAVWEAPPAGPE